MQRSLRMTFPSCSIIVVLSVFLLINVKSGLATCKNSPKELLATERKRRQFFSPGLTQRTFPTMVAPRQRKKDKANVSTLQARGGQATTTTTGSPNTSAEVSEAANEKISSLSKLRQTVFPIYGQEVTKFFLLAAIKFFIILALTLTRDTKDTLVVTQCGAEAIAFLKVRTAVIRVYVFVLASRLIISALSPWKDIRSPSSSNCFYCPLFQIVRYATQENIVLHYLHSILFVLWLV